MAKKNITFRIDEKLIEKLNKLRGNTSQNNFLELLITGFTSTSTSTSNNQDEILVQLQLLAKSQEKLQAQVQLLANQTQTKTIVKEVIIERDEEGNVLTEYVDEAPPVEKLAPEAFYGKVPEPYGKGEHDDDPLKYLDEEEEEFDLFGRPKR